MQATQRVKCMSSDNSPATIHLAATTDLMLALYRDGTLSSSIQNQLTTRTLVPDPFRKYGFEHLKYKKLKPVEQLNFCDKLMMTDEATF